MNRASSATGWVRNPVMKSGAIDQKKASSYDLGYTWNPITGCMNHIDGMCMGGGFPCYAYKLANGRVKHHYLANKNTATSDYDEDSYPFYLRFWPKKLGEMRVTPRRRAAPGCSGLIYDKGIFVCDMGDLFGIGVPEEWTRTIIRLIRKNHRHRFYLLTKQPQNLPRFSPFPDNCWVGVTVTSDGAMTMALTCLGSIEAKVKYLSCEPLLGAIQPPIGRRLKQAGIGWVIIGAQTKPYKPPQVQWVWEIVQAAGEIGIPVFLKDNLEHQDVLPIAEPFYRHDDNVCLACEMEEACGACGDAFRLRQEMPVIAMNKEVFKNA